jgi:peptidoglycan hydrolase-like protein with peptidoglycan-binding domain
MFNSFRINSFRISSNRSERFNSNRFNSNQFNNKQFNPRHRLGILTVATLAAILTLPFPAQALRFGDRGDDVRELQDRLNLPQDGIYGSDTEDAVRRYQRRRGLTVDGIAGSRTLRSMGLDHLVDGGSDRDSTAAYAVIVPGDRRTLDDVRVDYPDAELEDSELGSFVRVGTFRDRDRADGVAGRMRRLGYRDARVQFRPEREDNIFR